MNRWTVLIAALVLWTLLSFGWLAFFSGGNGCKILQTVPPDGSHATLRPLTQAEMDAQIAADCGTPRPNQLLVVGAGYFLIAIPGLYMTAGKREKTEEP
ncbi:MAG: hypothetical protein ACXWNI_06775 [Candidatus Limnocylindrales bacterium]